MFGSISLRQLLAADGAMCLVAGAGLLAAAGVLAEFLALPPALLFEAGLILAPWGVFVLWCASRAAPGRRAVLTVVVVNALWAAGSVALLGWLAPNALGIAFVLVQAAASAGFAVLQARALPPAVRLQAA